MRPLPDEPIQKVTQEPNEELKLSYGGTIDGPLEALQVLPGE